MQAAVEAASDASTRPRADVATREAGRDGVATGAEAVQADPEELSSDDDEASITEVVADLIAQRWRRRARARPRRMSRRAGARPRSVATAATNVATRREVATSTASDEDDDAGDAPAWLVSPPSPSTPPTREGAAATNVATREGAAATNVARARRGRDECRDGALRARGAPRARGGGGGRRRRCPRVAARRRRRRPTAPRRACAATTASSSAWRVLPPRQLRTSRGRTPLARDGRLVVAHRRGADVMLGTQVVLPRPRLRRPPARAAPAGGAPPAARAPDGGRPPPPPRARTPLSGGRAGGAAESRHRRGRAFARRDIVAARASRHSSRPRRHAYQTWRRAGRGRRPRRRCSVIDREDARARGRGARVGRGALRGRPHPREYDLATEARFNERVRAWRKERTRPPPAADAFAAAAGTTAASGVRRSRSTYALLLEAGEEPLTRRATR